MAVKGLHGVQRIIIDSQEVEGVEDAIGLEASISFEDGAIQGLAVIDSLTFVRDARQLIKQRINSGLNGGLGIFEGIDIAMEVENINQSANIFKGYIDVSKAEIDDSRGRINAPIVKADDLQTLDMRLSAINYGFLENEGVFTDADYIDVDYQVIKDNNAVEILVSSVLFYLMLKETYVIAKDLAKSVATATGIASGSISGGIGALAFTALSTLAQSAYAFAMLSAVVNLGRDLISALLPPKRTHKAITYRKMLNKTAEYLGFTIDTDLSIFDKYVYLASNTSADSFDKKGFLAKAGTIKVGLPKSGDLGYNCSEFFGHVAKLENTTWGIKGNSLILRNRESDYWKQKTSYNMPDILPPSYTFNTDELIANTSYNFATDLRDSYTVSNYKGTNYQVNISPKVIGKAGNVVIEGFNDVNFGVALASRKDTLSGLEKALAAVGKQIDNVVNLFKGRSNIEGSIKNTVGVMKVSDNYHSVPKILYMENGRIPANHRDLLSAKAIYHNNYYQSSLANSTFSGQKLIYENVSIPFNFQDFLKVSENAYFYDSEGRLGKFIGKPVWKISDARLIASFEVSQVYTRNLQEKYREQE